MLEYDLTDSDNNDIGSPGAGSNATSPAKRALGGIAEDPHSPLIMISQSSTKKSKK